MAATDQPSPDKLEQLAVRHAALLEEIEAISSTPRPIAEAQATIRDAIGRVGQQLHPVVHYASLRDVPQGGRSVLNSLRDALRGSHPGAPTALELACVLQPDLVEKWLAAELQSFYATRPTPMARPEFDAAHGKLATQLAAVETEASATWWQLLRRGFVSAPPAFISGEALLGLPANAQGDG